MDAIKYLLSVGHPVDVIDENGWPPLLYANFQTEKQCVVELFSKNPKQLFFLGRLMSSEHGDDMRQKNVLVILKLLR